MNNLVCTTPIRFYEKTSSYGVGGSTVAWNVFDIDGKIIFPCEWTYLYGNDLISAQSQNAVQPARIRMHYAPELFRLLVKTDTVIIRGTNPLPVVDGSPDFSGANCFVAFGSVDDYSDKHQILEIRLKRWEAK